jgi:hypothetical protein
MSNMGRGGIVVVVRPRYRSSGLRTCGWMAKPRLLLSSAKVEALIHAARHDCEPAVPLIQLGVMMTMARRGTLGVDCRQARGGQPPWVDHRQGVLQALRWHSSSNRRDRAAPHSTANLLLQLTHTVSTADRLQLNNTNNTGNAIADGTQLPASRVRRHHMGYSPPRASSEGQGT